VSRRRTTAGLSLLVALLGVVLMIETALLGGQTGFVVGALFTLAGALRLYLSLR
jgi:hypothetical protein